MEAACCTSICNLTERHVYSPDVHSRWCNRLCKSLHYVSWEARIAPSVDAMVSATQHLQQYTLSSIWISIQWHTESASLTSAQGCMWFGSGSRGYTDWSGHTGCIRRVLPEQAAQPVLPEHNPQKVQKGLLQGVIQTETHGKQNWCSVQSTCQRGHRQRTRSQQATRACRVVTCRM
jgi:hypothetical protein